MLTATSQEQEILTNAKAVLDLLGQGEFIKAMDTYLDEDVSLWEGNNEAKKGKAFCIKAEEDLLATVTAFHGYTVKSGPAVSGDTSFYEAVMEFDTNDGTKHRFEQVVRTKWKNGKIIDERYYHA